MHLSPRHCTHGVMYGWGVQVNTGTVGVCNITVEIEGVERAISHYPDDWLNEDGDDDFPNFTYYFAPKQIALLGATIPLANGVPEVSIAPTFAPCQPDPNEPISRRPHKCKKIQQDGGQLSICTFKELKQWTPFDGDERIVMVEGYIQNTGKLTACDIEVYIENFENNEAFWGEW